MEEYQSSREATIAKLTADLTETRSQLACESTERDRLGQRVISIENELNDNNR